MLKKLKARLKMWGQIIGAALGYTTYRGTKKAIVDDGKDKQIDTVARTLWGEARGEGVQGMQAVANVIMNRVKKGGWLGTTPEEVCLKPSQFSCWLKSDPNRQKLLAVNESDNNFLLAKQLATSAVNGKLPDITNGATHYLALGSLSKVPSWASSMKKVASIGNHTFYA